MVTLLLILLSTALYAAAITSAADMSDYVHYKSSLRIDRLLVNIDNRIAFHYNATKLTENHQHIRVSWEGVYSPNKYHHVALYVGHGFIDPKLTLPAQVCLVDSRAAACPVPSCQAACAVCLTILLLLITCPRMPMHQTLGALTSVPDQITHVRPA